MLEIFKSISDRILLLYKEIKTEEQNIMGIIVVLVIKSNLIKFLDWKWNFSYDEIEKRYSLKSFISFHKDTQY